MKIDLPENWSYYLELHIYSDFAAGGRVADLPLCPGGDLQFHLLCDQAAGGRDPDLPLRPGGEVQLQAADCPHHRHGGDHLSLPPYPTAPCWRWPTLWTVGALDVDELNPDILPHAAAIPC